MERLETRWVPAQFGVPWHDPFHLSVSFAPDGTAVAGHASNLFQTLDAAMPQPEWQAQILQAFEAWAAQADLNFALVPDGGEPFGTPGPDQHDPRFGDIRIGAQPMPPDVLAISVPHDPFLSGTWSGDILLNSNVQWNGQSASLLPVMLHEVGHVLGFDENSDPGSVMFANLVPQNTSLSPGDIEAVQDAYGPRLPDTVASPPGASVVAAANPFPAPQGYDGTTPLFLYSDLAASNAADVFSLQAPAGYSGPVTFRLQSAGVSLLMPRLTVYDADGRVVGDVASTAEGGDTLLVTLPNAAADETFYVRVQAATGGIFGVGEYALAVNFDARSTVSQDAIDRLARQSYGYLSPDDLNAIFVDPQHALFGDDHHTDDTFATAQPLQPADASYGSEGPVRTIASLSDRADVDYYHFETPEESSSDAPLVMTVTVRATEVNGLMPSVSVLDASGAAVPAQVLAHGDGTYTIEVAGAAADTTYYVRVAADPTISQNAGNYDLDIEYGHVAADPVTFVASAGEAATATTSGTLVVDEPQLFDFLLAAPGTTAPGAALMFTLTDAAGRLVASRTASDGITAGGDAVLLVPGVYHARFSAQGVLSSWSFRLYGASLSDPIGPALDDPTLAPIGGPASTSGGPVSPGIGSTDSPYQWLAVALGAPPARALSPAGRLSNIEPQVASASDVFGAAGSIAAPSVSGAASAPKSGVASGPIAPVSLAVPVGRGPVASASTRAVSIAPSPFAGTSANASPSPPRAEPTAPAQEPADAGAGAVAPASLAVVSVANLSPTAPVADALSVLPSCDVSSVPLANPAQPLDVVNGLTPGSTDDSPGPAEPVPSDELGESLAGLVVRVGILVYGGWVSLHHSRAEADDSEVGGVRRTV